MNKLTDIILFLRISILIFLLSYFSFLRAGEPIDQIYAIVNQDPITKQEFDNKMDMISSQYIAFGKTIPPKKQLTKEVLSKLIDDSLQLQLAEQNNVTATSAEVKEAIAGIAFRNQMSFTELKKNIVNSGQSFDNYENEIKIELIISKLHQQVIRPIQITEQQINEYLTAHGKLDKSKAYHLEDIKISLPEDPSDNDITVATTIAKTLVKSTGKNKKIRDIIENINDDRYPIIIVDRGFQTQAEMPTLFAKEIKKIKKGSLSKPIETPNGIHVLHLITTKNVQPTSYVNQLHVHHILIKPDSLGGSMTEAKKEADKIYKTIKDGANFYEVAKDKSHDSNSAPKKGDLGWHTADDLPPQLALAVNNIKVNELSKPIESPVGWHLLMIKNTKKVDISKNLERKQALQYLTQKEHNEQLNKWLSQLKYSAYIKIMKKELQDL